MCLFHSTVIFLISAEVEVLLCLYIYFNGERFVVRCTVVSECDSKGKCRSSTLLVRKADEKGKVFCLYSRLGMLD